MRPTVFWRRLRAGTFWANKRKATLPAAQTKPVKPIQPWPVLKRNKSQEIADRILYGKKGPQ